MDEGSVRSGVWADGRAGASVSHPGLGCHTPDWAKEVGGLGGSETVNPEVATTSAGTRTGRTRFPPFFFPKLLTLCMPACEIAIRMQVRFCSLGAVYF